MTEIKFSSFIESQYRQIDNIQEELQSLFGRYLYMQMTTDLMLNLKEEIKRIVACYCNQRSISTDHILLDVINEDSTISVNPANLYTACIMFNKHFPYAEFIINLYTN